MSALDQLARQLRRLEQNVRDMQTQPQLAHSSLEDGAVRVYDRDGTQVMQVGKQYDGTYVAAPVAGPVPPTPSTPVVSTYLGGLKVRWDGTFADGSVAPMDFSRVEVHVADHAFVPAGAETLRSTVESPRGGDVVVPLPGVQHFVRLVARSLAGVASAPSEAAYGTPEVLDPEDFKGQTIFFNAATSPPVAPRVGDLWLRPDDTAVRWDGATWQLSADQESVVAALRDLRVGNTAVQPNSLVASDVIATGTVTAGLLEATLVLASEIVAGPPAGTHARMTPSGFRVFAEDPTDGVPNEVIRLGTTTDDYFGIIDSTGKLLASIDADGVINGQGLSVAGDPMFGGRSLSSMLAGLPKGLRERTGPVSVSLPGIVGEIGLVELAVTTEPGRIYRLEMHVPWTRSDGSGELDLLVRDGGTGTPTTASTITGAGLQASGVVQGYGTRSEFSQLYAPATPGLHRLLVTAARGGGGTVSVQGAVSMDVYDVGLARPGTGVLNTGGGSLPNTTPPPVIVTQPRTQRTNQWGPTWTGTWRQNGSLRNDTPDLVQGYVDGSNGNQRAAWGFPDLTAELAGASVDKVEIYLYANHWYNNSGGTLVVGWGNDAARPAGLPLSHDTVQIPGWPKPGGRWFDVTGWGGLIQNGTMRSVVMGPGPSTSAVYYGKFDSNSPVIRITYTK